MGPRSQEMPAQFQNAQAPGQRLYVKRHRELRPHDDRIDAQASPAGLGPGLVRPPSANACDQCTQDGTVGPGRHGDAGIESAFPACQRLVSPIGQPQDRGRSRHGGGLRSRRSPPTMRPTLGSTGYPQPSYRLYACRAAIAQDDLMPPTYSGQGHIPDRAGGYHRTLGDAQGAKRHRGR